LFLRVELNFSRDHRFRPQFGKRPISVSNRHYGDVIVA